jgi:O-antigen/teichoic acid export membrane protein
MAEKFLTKRSFKAGSWLISHNAIARFSGLIKTIIIARILTPAQFGVFGVAALALSLLETFSETGAEHALVQKEKVDNLDIATTWWISLFRGLLIGAILYFSAPFVGRFFENGDAVIFIQAIALAPIIRNLRNPSIVFYRKKLSFRQDFYMRTSGTLAELVVGVTVSYMTRSVWGLVASILVGAVAETISSYLVASSFRLVLPKWERARGILSFGGWIWLSSIITYLLNQGDDAVVGKLLGVTTLGYYQNAYKIASLPATQITGMMTQVTYPAFASIQDDKVRLARAYKKSFLAALGTTVFFSAIIILFAREITLITLGDQWLPVVPALKVLTIFGVVRSLAATVGPVFQAVGKPNILVWIGLYRLVVLAAIIFPLTTGYGMVGTSWAIVISSLLTIPAVWWQLNKILS